MKKYLNPLIIIAVFACGMAAQGGLFFYEPFPTSYTNGGTLATMPNGSTFAGTRLNDQTAVWNIGSGGGGGSPTNTFGAALSHGILSYSNGSCGLYLATNATSGNRTRGVLLTNTPINKGSVYMSFLMNVQVAAAGNRLFALFSSATTGSPGASTAAGVWLNSTTNLMLSKSTLTVPAATSTASLTPGTHLIVVRYTYNSGSTTDDQMDLWIDPGSLGVGEGSLPASDLVYAAGTDVSSLSSFYIYHPSSGYVAAGLFVDEIRVGTTWADVTPTAVCVSAGAGTGPTNQASVAGATASFSVSPTGTLPNYQWQLSTDNGANWNNVSSGGNAANYTTPTLVGSDNNSKFRCIITAPCDSSSATSAVATLTVQDPTGKWFRSVASGNWNNLATWEQSSNGSTWVAATLTPSAAGSNITVRAGHTVSVTAAANADDLTIEAGAELDASGATLTIADGAAAIDCNVSGTLRVTSTASSALVTGTAGLRFNSGGKFQWSGASAPTIPTATWADGSLCLIDNTASAAVNCTGVSGQSFYDFTVNYPSVGFRTRLNITGVDTTIRRHLAITIPDVAAASVQLLTNSGTVLTIGGDFTVNTGTAANTTKILTRSASAEISTIKVAGNVTINGYMDLFSTATGGQTVFEFNGGNTILTLDNAHQIVGNTNNVSYVLDTGAGVVLNSSVPGSTAFTVGTNAALSVYANRIYGAAAGSFTMSPGSIVSYSGTNQITAGFGTINYAGSVNLGTLPSFAGGETFVVFGGSATPTYTGSFTLYPSEPSVSQTWDTTALNTTGTLGVSGAAGPSAGHIDSGTVTGGNLVFNVSGGPANTAFSVISTTDLTTARATWSVIGSGTFDGAGAASVTNPAASTARFYSLRIP